MLVLGQPEVHRRKLLEPGGAAVFPSAAPHTGEPGRLIAHPDLPQLDSGAKQGGEVPHQRSEVDPLVRREINGQLVPVPLPFSIADFHQQLRRPGPLDDFLPHFLFAHPKLLMGFAVFHGSSTHHGLERPGVRAGFGAYGAAGAPAALLEGGLAHGTDPAEVATPLDLDNDRLLYVEGIGIILPHEVGLSGALEPDLDRLTHQSSVNAPIAAYFSALRRTSFSGRILRSSVRCRMSASRKASPAPSGSTCAPPTGSLIISSITFKRSRSSAVILSASAARSL